MKLLVAFLLLQLADFGTTVAALALGGTESNPLVGHLMGLGDYTGLAVAKLIALAIGGLAAFYGKYNGLRKMNVLFTVIVIWNLTIIGRLIVA